MIRRTYIVLTYAAVVAALLLIAAGDKRPAAFSLDVADAEVIAKLPAGARACQGPFTVSAAFDAITLWVATHARTAVSVSVLASGRMGVAGMAVADPSHSVRHRLPVGIVFAPFRAVELTVRLPRTVAARRRITVCIRGRHALGLVGGVAPPTAGPLTGVRSTGGVALVFVAPRPRSLLSTLPTIFDRAALFKARWVGPWTFWLIAAGLVVAFVLAWLAIAAVSARE
jgi:hypothetical protein